MIVEKRQLLFVEMIVNGRHKTFKLTVPFDMSNKEVKEKLLSNYKDFDSLVGKKLSDGFQDNVRVTRIEKDMPLLSLI